MSSALEPGRKVVLVVDDNDLNLNLKLVTVIMTRAGFSVLAADSAESALAVARRDLPHLNLMDVKLPGTDGLDATRSLKADPVTAAIPVVDVTAWARAEDRERALAAGCVEFVTKPINMKELVSVARRLTGGGE